MGVFMVPVLSTGITQLPYSVNMCEKRAIPGRALTDDSPNTDGKQ